MVALLFLFLFVFEASVVTYRVSHSSCSVTSAITTTSVTSNALDALDSRAMTRGKVAVDSSL